MPGARHTLLVTPKVGCGKYGVSLEHVQVCCLQPPRAASESCACLLEGKGIGGGGKKLPRARNGVWELEIRHTGKSVSLEGVWKESASPSGSKQ